MAGCFPDFRGRASSFDLHNLQANQKMSILNRLFRSKSDSGLKLGRRSPTDSPNESPRHSPRASPGAPPRRRFARVIRDDEARGEEYINPHVIRKYNKGFYEEKLIRKSVSLEETGPKPYEVPETTILKKHRSMEGEAGNNAKHACFNEDVEVVEYDTKEKCATIMNEACIVHQRLQDDILTDGLVPDIASTNSQDEEVVQSIIASLDLSLAVISELRNGENSVENSPITEQNPVVTNSESCTDDHEKRPLPERQSSSESEDEGRSAPKKSKTLNHEVAGAEGKTPTQIRMNVLEVES